MRLNTDIIFTPKLLHGHYWHSLCRWESMKHSGWIGRCLSFILEWTGVWKNQAAQERGKSTPRIAMTTTYSHRTCKISGFYHFQLLIPFFGILIDVVANEQTVANVANCFDVRLGITKCRLLDEQKIYLHECNQKKQDNLLISMKALNMI